MTETPEPEEEGAQTFADLGIHADVLEAIEEMGWETPTPVPVPYTHLTLPPNRQV